MIFGTYAADGNTKDSIYKFGGLNRTRKGNKYEFSDMLNMSADEYPCAAPRGRRKKIAEVGKINAICAPDSTNVSEITGITGVCDGGFYYNGELKSDKFKLDPEWKWQIEQKGNTYIINGYDRENKKSLMYYYNIDTDEFAEGGKVMRNLILESYGNYLATPITDEYGKGDYECTTPDGTTIKNSDFWLNYREYTTYDADGNTTMSSGTNIFEQYFKIGDEITIENFPGTNNGGQLWTSTTVGGITPQPGVTAERNNTIDTDNMTTTDSVSIHSICVATITGFGISASARGRARHVVYFDLKNKNGDAVEFSNMTERGIYCSGVTLKKRTRVFDNITIHQGRIWGSIPSGNQIYASASDDIFSFSAADVANRYAARIPSDTPGTFTALCSYNNDLVAFKPDSVTVISGINPFNYNAVVISGIGCISPKSVAVTQEGVIFLGYNGFYIYDGSVPRCISAKLNTKYISAVSGYDGLSCYISALTADGDKELLVYNMRYGLWHKQDDFDATGFFRFKNEFYVSDELSLYKTAAEPPGEWECSLMRTHDNNLDNKGINEIWIRAEVVPGAEFWVETAVGNGEFKRHSSFSKAGLNIYSCPVRLEMGEDYQIKICGKGKVVLYEIETRKPESGRRYKEY